MDATAELLLLNSSMEDTEDVDYYDEYDMEDIKKTERKARKKQEKREKTALSKDGAVRTARDGQLGEWRMKLPERTVFMVHIGSHDMKYKDQNWIISERDIEYTVVPITNIGRARAAARDTGMDMDAAENGTERWLEVCTYEEAVPSRATQLALARLTYRDGRVGLSIFYKNEALSELKVKRDKIKKQIDEEIRKYVRGIRRRKK